MVPQMSDPESGTPAMLSAIMLVTDQAIDATSEKVSPTVWDANLPIPGEALLSIIIGLLPILEKYSEVALASIVP